MAGKHDELFYLGTEDVGADLSGAPEQEAPASMVADAAPPRSSRPRAGRLLILGALPVVIAVVALSRAGGDAAPPSPQAGVPVAEDPPQVSAITADSARPRPAILPLARRRERSRRHVLADERGEAEEQTAPAEPAETAPVVTYVPTPTAAPEAAPAPAPEGPAAAPAPATPVTSARPEFGIER